MQLQSLEHHPAVLGFRMRDYRRWATGFYYRIDIDCVGGTQLFAREYSDQHERNYSFHWQTADGTLLCRWDNAPHHHHLVSYPHHLHRDDQVLESRPLSLMDVLDEIGRSV